METQKLHEQKAPKKAQSQQPRLCLAWRLFEAEPLNRHSQAEPGNE